MSILAFVFMGLGFRPEGTGAGLFKLLASIIFVALSLVLFADFDISFTEQITFGGDNGTSTKHFISNSNTGGDWLGWLYFILAIVNTGIFMLFAITGKW